MIGSIELWAQRGPGSSSQRAEREEVKGGDGGAGALSSTSLFYLF